MPQDKENINMTCDELNTRAKLLENGMTGQDVIKILGTPRKKDGDVWLYYGYTGQLLPHAGEQYIDDATLIFENRRVKDIRHSWMDATGPEPHE
jgi:hypothetical protein